MKTITEQSHSLIGFVELKTKNPEVIFKDPDLIFEPRRTAL